MTVCCASPCESAPKYATKGCNLRVKKRRQKTYTKRRMPRIEARPDRRPESRRCKRGAKGSKGDELQESFLLRSGRQSHIRSNYRSDRLNKTVDGSVAGFTHTPSDHADDNKNGKPNGDPKKDLLQMRQSRCCVVSHSSRSRMCPKGLSARTICLSLITFSHI